MCSSISASVCSGRLAPQASRPEHFLLLEVPVLETGAWGCSGNGLNRDRLHLLPPMLRTATQSHKSQSGLASCECRGASLLRPSWSVAAGAAAFSQLLRARRHLGLAAHHAESNILRRRSTIRFRVRRTIRAAANHFSFAVPRQHPFANVSAEIVNWLFILFTLSAEAANLFQQW